MKIETVKEWADNPVTVELLAHVVSQIKALQEVKGDCYHPFQPEKTQETLAGLNGAEDTWQIVGGLLTGDWDYFDSGEDNAE